MPPFSIPSQLFHLMVLCILISYHLICIEAGPGAGPTRHRFHGISAGAPNYRRFIAHNFTDVLSPYGHPWGCDGRAVDHYNFFCMDEKPGYSAHQRFLGDVLFDADDNCYQKPPLGGPTSEDPQYLKLLELSGGGWGGVGTSPTPGDSCGPTYTAVMCFQHFLAKRVVEDNFFHTPQDTPLQICQEGFNTGREAYIWLAADPKVKLLAFDIERDVTYVRAASDLITKQFGENRFELIVGNVTEVLMEEFLASHKNFPGCDIISLTGETSSEVRTRGLRAWRRVTNQGNLILSDNTQCSSNGCQGPTNGIYRLAESGCRLDFLYYQFKVSYHETMHRTKHNGALKVVNAPRICGFAVLHYNMTADKTNLVCP